MPKLLTDIGIGAIIFDFSGQPTDKNSSAASRRGGANVHRAL